MDNKKYQWTIMWNSKRGSENITVRTDDKEEFDKLRKEYGDMASKDVNPPMDTREEKVQNFVKEYEADSNKCPKCGNPTKESWSKDKSKHYIKCSTAGWDRNRHEATGCSYIKWL